MSPEDDSGFDTFFKAFFMIVVSEIGDKTFLIAAILATRHPRITVFAGALTSLIIMSILSAALGRVILGLIPKAWTLWAAAGLFLVFGVKMLQEARAMSSDHMADEMREAEEEIDDDSQLHGSSVQLEALEEGRGRDRERGASAFEPSARSLGPLDNSLAPRSPSRSGSPASAGRGLANGSSSIGIFDSKGDLVTRARETARWGIRALTNPVFAQAFILTFLGEWGDRSQITTIAMAGAHSIPVIAFGTIVGHGCCTALAVMGGRWVSTKVSVKHISYTGACAFLIFSVLYALEAYQTPTTSEFMAEAEGMSAGGW